MSETKEAEEFDCGPVRMTAGDILRKAASLVEGDRDLLHGNKVESFARIAKSWNWFLSIRADPYSKLDGSDVAYLMALLKIARSQSGAYNPDDAIDAAGYLGIAGELQNL